MLIRFKVVSNWKISRRVVGTERNKEVVHSQLAASSWQQRRKNADRCKKKTEQNSLSRRRTDVSCYIRAAFFKVLVSVNRFLQRRERQRRTSRVARPATDLAVGRNSSVSFRPAINFLFLSSSLMAHFNSKLNTLAALISPNLAGRHLRVHSFRNFFFPKVWPIPDAYEHNEETRYANYLHRRCLEWACTRAT